MSCLKTCDIETDRLVGDRSPNSRQLVVDSSKRYFSRRLIADQSAISRRQVGDHLATYATSSRSNSVAASLLCMFKRQLATDFNRRLVGDFKKTFPRLLQPLRNFSFFGCEPVANRLQSRCKHALSKLVLGIAFIYQNDGLRFSLKFWGNWSFGAC